MNIADIQLLERDLVIDNQINREYSLVFEGSNFIENYNSCIIPVKSRREVELLLILGEAVNVIMDETARIRYPDVWDWLSGRTYSDIFTNLKWSYPEEDEVLTVIEKIPPPPTLKDSFLKLYSDDPVPDKIEKQYVQRINNDNILISKPYRSGNIFYFNGLHESSESNIDQYSGHLKGNVIFEAARQAGIASLHLTGIPLSGKIVLIKTVITRYTKLVENSEPYLMLPLV